MLQGMGKKKEDGGEAGFHQECSKHRLGSGGSEAAVCGARPVAWEYGGVMPERDEDLGSRILLMLLTHCNIGEP